MATDEEELSTELLVVPAALVAEAKAAAASLAEVQELAQGMVSRASRRRLDALRSLAGLGLTTSEIAKMLEMTPQRVRQLLLTNVAGGDPAASGPTGGC